MPKRAVLIPVYNESQTIECVLDEVRRYYDGEIIVVDDGSTDGSCRILGERNDVTLLRFANNQGYGAALIAGFDLARDMEVDHLVTMDCDGQHEPSHVNQFFEELLEGGDIISGSRYLPESSREGVVPPDRRAVNASITETINKETGWHLTDSFCGFKGYRMAALAKLDLEERGYALPLEIWAKAYRAGLAVREIPVDRIYLNVDRTFGAQMDNPGTREAFYREVWYRYLRRYAWSV